MIYRVLYPYYTELHAVSLDEAVSNWIRLYHHLNINKLIIEDNKKHWKVRMKKLANSEKHRVGFKVTSYPYMVLMNR